jgi:ATP-dependent helicase HrpB
LLRASGPNRNVDLRLRVEALRPGFRTPAGMTLDTSARQRSLRTIDLLERQSGASSAMASSDDAEVGRLLAFAYPDRIAQSRGGAGRYLLTSGRGATLPEAQSLARSEFLVVADVDAGDREAVIRLAAPIDRRALEEDFAEQIDRRERFEWDSREQAVVARDERWLGQLKLDERRIERPDPSRLSAAMLAGVRELGIGALPWSKESRALQARLQFVRRVDDPSRAWPDVSDETLLATLDQWLAPWIDGTSRREHLSKLDLTAILTALLDWPAQQRLNAFAPTHLTVPSGSRIPIDYSTEAPSVSVRLQEVFGLQVTPTVGDGRVPLTLQLLSPAHRPVQVTRDLASFWSRGYPEVKKELKGRYPKHYWPDDPLTAEPTARAKPK